MSRAAFVCVCVSVCLAASCQRAESARHLARPAPPLEGIADAHVLFLKGSVAVTPAQGAAFAAKLDSDLVATDTVEPGSGAFVIVLLKNGHAVRVDDAGKLAVKDILLFQAPPIDRPVDEMVRELLDADELAAVPVADVRERAAAWRQMLRAAESGDTERSSDRSVNKAAAAGSNVASVEPRPPPPVRRLDDSRDSLDKLEKKKEKAAEPSAKDSPTTHEEGGGTQPAGGGGVLGGVQNRPASVPPVAPPYDVRAGATPAAALAAARTTLPAELAAADLGRCLATAPAGAPLTSVVLLLEVKSGVVVRVRMGGALPVPACAKALVKTPLTGAADGWLVVTVPLGG